MSATKELDRIASEIARELEPKVFEMISWGLTKTDLEDVEGYDFIEHTIYIANRAIEKLTKNINKNE